MTRVKSKLMQFGLLLVALIIGIVVGAFGCGYQYQSIVLPNCAADYAGQTASMLNTVSMLRLGETEEAIQYLDLQIDHDILYLDVGMYGIKTDFILPVLSKARTYRDHYPSVTKDSAKVTDVLERYQPVAEFTCKSPLCRLIEKSTKTD